MDVHTTWQGFLLIKMNTVENVEYFLLNWGKVSLFNRFYVISTIINPILKI
jgi:hypothetical protein